MWRVVFLFGAGASYGAGSILPEAPPLGDGLYDALARSYRASWGALPSDVQASFQRDGFEVGMKLVFDRYGQAIPQLMREMAVYFIQFRPYRQGSLYCRLIRDLSQAHVLGETACATLNYDCVLEFSLLQQGHSVSYFPGGTPEGLGMPVWKLHGSCNMFSQSVQAGPGILYGTGVTWEGGAQAILDPDRVIEHCLVETGLAPIMSLYMAGKQLNVSPTVVQAIRSAWSDAVQSAQVVVIVGVRPNAEDTHVWEPVASAPATLLFVGDQRAFEMWRQQSRPAAPTEYLGGYFGDSYSAILERIVHHGA